MSVALASTTTALERVIHKLEELGCGPTERGAVWNARCPAHEDHNPSLVVGLGLDDCVLVTCHAGCDLQRICDAMGMRQRELYNQPPERDQPRRIVATYPYIDEAGEVLYEVVRYEPKDFRQRRPDGNGGWTWSLNGVDRVLYRLPQVLQAVADRQLVWITEGEKDADALQAVLPEGEVATTNAGGAKKWRPEYSEALEGAGVIIWADADAAGRAHAGIVREAIAPVAATVTVVESSRFKDAAEHLGAGLTLHDIVTIDPDQATTDEDEVPEGLESWQPIDLQPILAGDHEQPQPTILSTRDEGGAFIYRSKVNGFHGDSGIGKSWLAYKAVAQELMAGRRAVIVDYEATAAEVVDRLLKIGTSTEAIAGRLTYIQPNDSTSEAAIAAVTRHIEPDTTIIVIDSLGEAFGVDGIDENADAEVGPWLRRVARPLAEAGPAVVLIDHGTKAADNPLHPSGSKRKRAAITGASYLVTAKATPTRETPGTLVLTCAKDRHGTYARGKVVASVDITPYPDGGVSINLHQHDEADQRPDAILEAVARAFVRTAQEQGRPLTRNELLALTATKARTETKRAAIDYAVGRGALSVESGPRNALLHQYVTDLPETTGDPL